VREDEQEFWERVAEYDRRFGREDFHGSAVASALALRREAEDMFADLSDCAVFAGDTENEEDYITWLQKAEEDVGVRIGMVTTVARNDQDAEDHLTFAYATLRAVAQDALSRKPVG
jgi:hypothetical protein